MWTDFLRVIKAFNDEGIDYVAVGGLAVILHGHVRLTTDLDVVIHLTPENTHRTVQLLTSMGFRPRAPVPPEQFSDASIRDNWVREKGLAVFSFYNKVNPLFDVDIFVQHPMDFKELLAQSVLKEVDGIPVRICGLDHLIRLKETAGRAKDLEDARVLRIIQNG